MTRIPPARIGVDTGGTFTDVVVSRAGSLVYFKVPSTPADPAQAILAGVSRAGASPDGGECDVVHGTTVATNALLGRTGARTGLVTTAGFEDMLTIGRQARPELYNLAVELPPSIVPAELCFGIRERVGPAGEELEALSERALDEIVERVVSSGAESVAVSLLFAFANPEHEQRIAARLRDRGIPVSVSSEILPAYREFERTATVAVNAYLEPRMRAYLARLEHEAHDRGVRQLRVMQSSGGSISARVAATQPVRTILSGPAGGVVAARRLAADAALGDLVTFDMGGTSTDVALVADSSVGTTNEARVAGLPVAVPIIDIHTVGAGGGSVARVDAGGALRVGPESAGADPGPACYGRGDLPTVTDANVVLGRLQTLLGGAMPLDRERAEVVMTRLAGDIERASGVACTTEDAALGVVRVASASMERALRVVSIERGYDPRRASLLSFGGAGGLHACDLAAALGMRRVVVPPFPGAFSALGLLFGDVVRDLTSTVIGSTFAAEDVFADLERQGIEQLAGEGFSADEVVLERSAALRYRGQSYEIAVPWQTDCAATFHELHRQRYGHADERRDVEVVTLNVRAIGAAPALELPRFEPAACETPEYGESSRVRLDDGWWDVPVYERDRLAPGHGVKGPAIVVEYGSTTLLPPRWNLSVDDVGCLLLEREV